MSCRPCIKIMSILFLRLYNDAVHSYLNFHQREVFRTMIKFEKVIFANTNCPLRFKNRFLWTFVKCGQITNVLKNLSNLFEQRDVVVDAAR